MIKTRTWIIIISSVFLISIAIWCFMLNTSHGTTAIIEAPGNAYHIDLTSPDNQNLTIEINNEFGKNVIQIEKGRVRMKEADCPDKVCVNAGWTSSSALPIVCLPHKVTITIVNDDTEIDAVTN